LIDLHHDQYKAFGFACRSGNFNLVKWLYGLGGVSNKKDDVFKMAILSGNLELVKWIYDYGGIQVNVKNSWDNFSLICYFNLLDLAHWFYNEMVHAKLNIHQVMDDLHFRMIIDRLVDNVEVLQWLYNFGGFENIIEPDHYKKAISKGQIALAVWLYKISRQEKQTKRTGR
jgi:hypothetical protein